MTNTPQINEKIKSLISERENQGEVEQVDEAKRLISEMDEIDTEQAFARIKQRLAPEKNNIRIWSFLTRVAAVLFIPLLLASSWLFYKQFNSDQSLQYAMQEITSPPGIRSQVVLPDGSLVWLNAESTIRFQVPFPKDIRNVDLMGEAFFKVTKNPQKPFIVQSGNVGVKVLGTSFNYKAFQEDKNIEVVLEEGKIALSLNTNSGVKETILNPGDRAVIEKSSGQSTISNQKINKYIAWHTGKLVFENTPMSEVALMLERWYGVDVVIEDSGILNYRFTTTFENESLFQVIELLGLSSPIRITYVPAIIGNGSQTQTRSKVLINKK